jgi:predicted ABC-type ATPase
MVLKSDFCPKKMPNLYIIAGCNGAGKTTASMTILPEILNCYEFVNADEIAKGLSPFQPEKVAIEAGRIMLNRMNQLIDSGVDFAFETTLATRSYVSFIEKAKLKGYTVTLVFIYLESIELAKKRVNQRVISGGHNIPIDVIERRYLSGLNNFHMLYLSKVHQWYCFDNSHDNPILVAEGNMLIGEVILENQIWSTIKSYKNV